MLIMQILGNDFNCYIFGLDCVYICWQFDVFGKGFMVDIGCMFNFFYSIDLVWFDDFVFDGVVVRLSYLVMLQCLLFVIVGVFLLEEFNLLMWDKWLIGVQVGGEIDFVCGVQFKFGLVVYDFCNMVGQCESVFVFSGFCSGMINYFVF